MKYLVSFVVTLCLLAVPVSSKQMYKVYVIDSGKVICEEESLSQPVISNNMLRVEFNGMTFIGFKVAFSAREIPWK